MSQPPRNIPNILLIVTDQQRTDTLGCYGARWMRTPNLDRLSGGGVQFDRAYCNNPVCAPSRASIFSGQNVSRHGVWNIGVSIPPDAVLLSHHLAAADFRTHYVGKTHFQPWNDPASREHFRWPTTAEEAYAPSPKYDGPYYGFQTAELAMGHSTWGMLGDYGNWVKSQLSLEEFTKARGVKRRGDFEFQGVALDWQLPTRLHNSVWTADRCIEFLRGHDPSRPFFLTAGFQDPHHPHALPTDFDLRVDESAVPAPDYDEGELDDKPPFFREARMGAMDKGPERGQFHVAGQHIGHDYRKVSPSDARSARTYYYGMAQLVDQQVGRILDHLDAAGLAQNTLVIFTTDHAELLGDHGLWLKGPFHYEQLIRVPLIMRWPAGFAPAAPTASMASLIDLAPTVLESAGLAVPADMDGRSLLPLLRGKTGSVRDEVLVEFVDDPNTLRLKTIVTPTRKLTWYASRPFGELYDLENDPREKVNRWDDPAYAGDKAQLLGRLLNGTERLEHREPRHFYV